MTQSNKTAQNPAKSRIKSLKSVTPQKATWRKWHNQPRLLARQAADERRHDRFFGRFDVIHHVTTTRSDFVSPFLFQLPLLPTCSTNLLHQPTINPSPPTSYLTRYFIRSTLQSIPSIGASINISAGDRYWLLCLWLCLLSPRYQSIYRPVIV